MSVATPLIDWPLRTALLPVLAAQGVLVRRSARKLQEPPGPRSGAMPNAEASLLILGDSSAAGVGCTHQDQALSAMVPKALMPDLPVRWTLIAKCGARTGDVLSWLDRDPPGCVDIAVTALGVNDVTKATTAGQWHRRQALLFHRLRDLGAKRIYACALPPMGHFPLLPNPLRWILGRQANAFDQQLQCLCAERPYARHVPFDFPMQLSDMAPDGYHPGPAIYAEWAQHLARIIRADFGRTADPGR